MRTRVCQVRRMSLATAAAKKCWPMLPACQYEIIGDAREAFGDDEWRLGTCQEKQFCDGGGPEL